MSTSTPSSSQTIFFANLLLISFAFTSFSLVDSRQHSIEEEALRCLDRCSDTDDVREYLACSKECELRFREPGKEVEEGARESRHRPRPRYPPRHRRGEEEEWPRHGGRGREEEEEWPRHGGRGREEEEEWPRHGGRGREEEEWPRHGGREEEVERPSPWREYQECRAHCAAEVGGNGSEERLKMCLERCDELFSSRGRRRHWVREREVNKDGEDDQCARSCERFRKGQERQLCRFRCSQKGGTEPGGKSAFSNKLTSYYGGRGREEGRMNPYYFRAERFQTLYGSREGEVRVLERFDDGSELLKGLKNVRLMVLEANPGTFILPHHINADCVLLVLKGKCYIK